MRLLYPSSRYAACSIDDIATPLSSLDSKVKEYDYIILGGGTAGCVLASRLSENPNISVLLLERGPVLNTWTSRMPLLSMNVHSAGYPIYRWPSAPIKGAINGSTDLVSGKVLGGTSKVNGFIYSRPFSGELDQWSRNGRKGWSYEDVKPLFIRSETSLTHPTALHRGTAGPWQIQASKIFLNSINRMVKAAETLGFPFIREANRPEGPTVGTILTERTVDANGYRTSASDAFLPESLVSERKAHLNICPNVLVTKIKFEEDESDISNNRNVRARGVFLEQDSVPETVRPASYYVAARKEIILCAGAIASPQLLMLSGIGPRSHLESMDVPIIKDMPGVGMHLQDHTGAAMIFRVPLEDTLHVIEQKPLHALGSFLQYLFFKRGLFTAPLIDVTIYTRSSLIDDNMEVKVHEPSESDARNPDNIPDIEIMPTPYNASLITKHPLKGKGLFSLISAVLQPKSTGTVRLASKDARIRPICELGLSKHPEDAVVLRRGVRLALRLARQMREEGYEMEDVFVPRSESDEDIDEFALKEPRSTFHYTSTCRMAPLNDPSPGVVDDELRVHGIEGLRIADGSILPNIPATHTQAAIVMVAEKCADLIKAGWKDS